jgi:hypothetical protein
MYEKNFLTILWFHNPSLFCIFHAVSKMNLWQPCVRLFYRDIHYLLSFFRSLKNSSLQLRFNFYINRNLRKLDAWAKIIDFFNFWIFFLLFHYSLKCWIKKIPLKNSIIINVPFKNIKMYLVERQSIFLSKVTEITPLFVVNNKVFL